MIKSCLKCLSATLVNYKTLRLDGLLECYGYCSQERCREMYSPLTVCEWMEQSLTYLTVQFDASCGPKHMLLFRRKHIFIFFQRAKMEGKRSPMQFRSLRVLTPDLDNQIYLLLVHSSIKKMPTNISFCDDYQTLQFKFKFLCYENKADLRHELQVRFKRRLAIKSWCSGISRVHILKHSKEQACHLP